MPLTGPIIRQYQPQQAVGVTPQDINASLQAYIQGITAANAPQMAEDQALNRQLKNLMMQEQILRLQGQVGALKNPEQAAVSKMALSLADDAGKSTSNVVTAARAGDVLSSLRGETIGQPGTVSADQNALNLAINAALPQDQQTYIPTGGNFEVAKPDLTSINTPAGTPTGFYDNPNKALEYEAAKEALKPYNLGATERRMVGSTQVEGPYTSEPKLEVKKEGNEMVVRNAITQDVVRREKMSPNEKLVERPNGVFRIKEGSNEPAQLVEGTAPSGMNDKAKEALTTTLSKQVQSSKSYQAHRTVLDAMYGLQATLDYAKTNPSDQTGIKSSAVDSFNKIINPDSIVRQQAFAQTTTGASLINKIDNFLGQLASGQTITPAQIQTMLDLAKKYEEGSRKSVQRDLAVLKHRGDKAGIDPLDYLPEIFGSNNETPPPTGQDAEALKWASDPANANNPDAIKILQLHGQ